MDDLFKDLRFGLRVLGRKPLLTVVAVVTLALGIGASTASGVMASLVFDVRDAVTFTGVAVLSLGVALSATYFPARQATRVDPMTALRSQ